MHHIPDTADLPNTVFTVSSLEFSTLGESMTIVLTNYSPRIHR